MFLALCIFLAPLTARGVELVEIARLAKGGASQLALSLLSAHQPDYQESTDEWLRWERVRLRILQEHQRWRELAERVASYPAGVSAAFAFWGRQQRADALINTGQYGEARQSLRQLIWQEGEPAAAETLAALRQLVMRSYLEEGRIEDASAAMLRYQQDYGEQGSEAMLLRARVLLAAGRPADSLALLRRLPAGARPVALVALAGLRSGASVEAVIEQARSRLERDETDRGRWLWSGVLAEAAEQQDDRDSLVLALETMLPLQSQVQGSERRLFDYKADDLWHAYLALGEQWGNRKQLLHGDDAAWLAAAGGLTGKEAARARALYAVVALRGDSGQYIGEAHAALLQQYVAMEETGMALLRLLYLESGRYGDAAPLPPVVAYRLVDEAIKGAELGLASSLLRHLPEPPGGTERFAWQMRRTKVFLLAGEYAEADRLLTAAIPLAGNLSDEQRDQLVQLLFDLQEVGEHERAYRLLSMLYEAVPAIKLRRELLFWMADSRRAQGSHGEAARLYLRSATLSDNNSMDPWAQTARYQAAKSLVEAGMREDAAYIYRQLLRITQSPERRSVLRHELHQLRLLGERG